MIEGSFGEHGELYFNIELITVNGEHFPVQVLLDTGFTTGYLAINSQDLEALEWSLISLQFELQTAKGLQYFDLYEGRVIIDGQEFIVPAYVGDEIPEILIGAQWLEIMDLIVKKRQRILILTLDDHLECTD